MVDALSRLPVQPLGPILPAPCAISLPLSTLAGIPPNTGKTTQLKATEERTLEKPGMLSDQILDKCSLPNHAFNENCPKLGQTRQTRRKGGFLFDLPAIIRLLKSLFL